MTAAFVWRQEKGVLNVRGGGGGGGGEFAKKKK
jgi:hypothetical protein